MKKFIENIKKNRQSIEKIVIAFLLIVIISFLVEYIMFAGQLKQQAKENQGVSKILANKITNLQNFSNEKDRFVSNSENASLQIQTDRKFIHNLQINLGEKPIYDISIQNVDPESGKNIVLQDFAKKGMKKNNFDFLKEITFKIDSNPEFINVFTPINQTEIKSIIIDNTYHFNYFRFLFFVSVGTLLLVFYSLRKKVGKKPELFFLAVSLILGTLISVSEPRTYVSWDEAIHFGRANKYSLQNLVSGGVSEIFSATNSVPASFSLDEQEQINANLDRRPEKKNTNKKNKHFWKNFSFIEIYNNVGYLPSAVALFFGRMLFLPAHIVFILGRWINVLVYSLLIYFAIRKLKSGKMILSLIALFPTAIFLASNYNYDSWVTAFTMLGLAYVFSELQQPEKKINKREAIIMIGAFVIGLGPKAIYFLLMLPLFLLKADKFSSKKQYKKFLAASIISLLFVLGSFLIPFVVGGPGKGDHRGGDAVNSTEQVKFIFSDPLVYTKILFNFLKEYLNPLNYGGLMTFFAYLGGIRGFYLVLFLITFVTFTDKNEYDNRIASCKNKLLMITIYLATSVLISTALYVAFTEVKNPIIAGVQPRYLIPLLFPLLLVIGSSRFKNPFNRNIYNTIIFASMAGILLLGIWESIIYLYY